jgi:hypothetical protein
VRNIFGKLLASAGVVMLGMNLSAVAQTDATTQPERIVIAPPKPIAVEFYLLTERSIFIKGRQTVYSGSDDGGGHSGAAKTEDTQIFNGATNTDFEMKAYIEDTTSGTINEFKVGDSIAKGKIVDITLDSLEYESGGKKTKVLIGQNLSGVDMVGSETVSSAPVGPQSDIIERMRRRRLEELGGK